METLVLGLPPVAQLIAEYVAEPAFYYKQVVRLLISTSRVYQALVLYGGVNWEERANNDRCCAIYWAYVEFPARQEEEWARELDILFWYELDPAERRFEIMFGGGPWDPDDRESYGS